MGQQPGLSSTGLAPAPTVAVAPLAERKLDDIVKGGPGPDWSWWRERCVLLSLSLLDAASDREKAFVEKWRARVSAGGLDDDDYDENGAGGGGGMGGMGRGGGGGARGSLAPPTYLGSLLSEQNTIALVARCVCVGIGVWIVDCGLWIVGGGDAAA